MFMIEMDKERYLYSLITKGSYIKKNSVLTCVIYRYTS